MLKTDIRFVKNKVAIMTKMQILYQKKEKLVIYEKKSSENRIELFIKLIKEGPTYACVICNRFMYQKDTKKTDQSKCKCPFDIIDLKFNPYDKMYICSTCHGHLKKQSEPPQSVWNTLNILSPPETLSNLNRIERVLISRN